MDHMNALSESATAFVLSTLPIWLGATVLLYRSTSRNTFWSECLVTIGEGQLFLVSTTLLSPVVYKILSEIKNDAHFPARRSIGCLTIVILLVDAAFFTLQLAVRTPNNPMNTTWSTVTFVISIAVLYISTVYASYVETGATTEGGIRAMDLNPRTGGLPIMEDRISFACLPVEQPIGTFYIAVVPYDVLTAISVADTRRLVDNDRDFEKYLGIQRPLNPKRTAEIEQYVNGYDATFPTAVIIAVDQHCASMDKRRGVMTLEPFEGNEDDDPILFGEMARKL